MLFSKRLPLIQGKKQKNRIFKKFKLFKNNFYKFTFFQLKCLSYIRIYINHIKMIDFFLRKCTSIFRRLSRKEYYKKIKERDIRVKFRFKILKKIFKRSSNKKVYKNCWYLNKMRRIFLKKYRRTHNTYLCFNHKKIPYTRKSLNSRMGKGKGSIKNWYLKYTSGKVLFYLRRWKTIIAIRALYYLKQNIPGRIIICWPQLNKYKDKSSTSFFSF